MSNTLRKFFIVIYMIMALMLFVVSARAYQMDRDLDRLNDKMESQRQKQELAIDTQRINDLERRLEEENQKRLSDRVTRLETIAETQHELLITVTAGLGILIVETGLRLILSGHKTMSEKKKKELDG